ncbi:MAG: DUF6305 family protein [Firmicutes bacterium]|nr:DUF6305 family protein [Bacillota bacterium]
MLAKIVSRRRILLVVIGLVAVVLGSGSVHGQPPKPEGLEIPETLPTLSGPVVVTTIGQSPGSVMVRMLFRRIGVACVQNDLLTHEQLAQAGKDPKTAYKTLIMTMGTSLKGMGGAGVDVDGEVARCNALVAQARKSGIFIIGAQIEGSSRRTDEYDEKSNKAVAPQSDLLIVRSEVDKDGYFTNTAKQKGIPIVRTKEAADFEYVFRVLFSAPTK